MTEKIRERDGRERRERGDRRSRMVEESGMRDVRGDILD